MPNLDSIDYKQIIDGVFNLIQEEKAISRPKKKKEMMDFQKELEKARKQEREDMLKLIEGMKKPKEPKQKKKVDFNATSFLTQNKYDDGNDWDACFAPRGRRW